MARLDVGTPATKLLLRLVEQLLVQQIVLVGAASDSLGNMQSPVLPTCPLHTPSECAASITVVDPI